MNCYTSDSTMSAVLQGGLNPYRVFVGGLTPEVQEHHLRQHFVQFGTVVAISIERSVRLKSKGYGYVDFGSMESALKACRWKTHHLLDQPVSVELARDYNARVSFHQERSSRKVAITGIPKSTDHNQLYDILSRFGEIEKVYKPRFIPSGMRISVVLMKRREDACKLINEKQLKTKGSSCMQFKPFDRSRAIATRCLDSVQAAHHLGRREARQDPPSESGSPYLQISLSPPYSEEVCTRVDNFDMKASDDQGVCRDVGTPTKTSQSTKTSKRMLSDVFRAIPEEHIPEYRFNLPKNGWKLGSHIAPASL